MIAGLATATIVASTRIMKKPISSAHKACQGLAARARGVIVSNKVGGTRIGEFSS